MTEDYFIVN